MSDIESPATSALRQQDTAPSVPLENPRALGGTVYDAISETLDRLGWTRGRAVARDGSVDLVRAIEITVDPQRRSRGADLARIARIRNHLAELVPSSSLAAWNDATERTPSEIQDVLSLAAAQHPLD